MSARNTFAATRRSHAILKKLRGGEGVTIREVSKKFGIQYPQARADLKLLEELYGLDTRRDGRIKVWEMPGAGDKKTPVSMAAALELGGVALDIFKHTPYGERIEDLADEWRQRVAPAVRERLQRLSVALVLRRNWLPTDGDKMVEVLEDFLDAIALRRGIDMTYERSDGEQREYLVIPRRLIWYQGRLWLQAVHEGEQKLFDVAGVEEVSYCIRTRLVERIVEERIARGEIEVPEIEAEEEDADEEVDPLQPVIDDVTAEVNQWFEYGSREEEDEYFANAFGIFATNFEAEPVEIIVRGSWANYLRRYRLHPSQENRESDDGLHVRFEIGLCPEFKSFLMGMIPDVEIVAPAELRKELVDRTRSWKS